MRRDGDVPMSIEFSVLEREALDEMAQRSGSTVANVIRTALWRHSEHLDMKIDLRLGVFDERHQTGRPRKTAEGSKTTQRREARAS